MPRKAINGPFGRTEERNGHAVAKLALSIFQAGREAHANESPSWLKVGMVIYFYPDAHASVSPSVHMAFQGAVEPAGGQLAAATELELGLPPHASPRTLVPGPSSLRPDSSVARGQVRPAGCRA